MFRFPMAVTFGLQEGKTVWMAIAPDQIHAFGAGQDRGSDSDHQSPAPCLVGRILKRHMSGNGQAEVPGASPDVPDTEGFLLRGKQEPRQSRSARTGLCRPKRLAGIRPRQHREPGSRQSGNAFCQAGFRHLKNGRGAAVNWPGPRTARSPQSGKSNVVCNSIARPARTGA